MNGSDVRVDIERSVRLILEANEALRLQVGVRRRNAVRFVVGAVSLFALGSVLGALINAAGV